MNCNAVAVAAAAAVATMRLESERPTPHRYFLSLHTTDDGGLLTLHWQQEDRAGGGSQSAVTRDRSSKKPGIITSDETMRSIGNAGKAMSSKTDNEISRAPNEEAFGRF